MSLKYFFKISNQDSHLEHFFFYCVVTDNHGYSTNIKGKILKVLLLCCLKLNIKMPENMATVCYFI